MPTNNCRDTASLARWLQRHFGACEFYTPAQIAKVRAQAAVQDKRASYGWTRHENWDERPRVWPSCRAKSRYKCRDDD